MVRLPAWQSLTSHSGVQEVFTVGCAFGMPHLKPWRFLSACLNLQSVERKCSRDHVHVQTSGSLTKASAVYPDGLAEAVRKAYEAALRIRLQAADTLDVDVSGLESPL